MNYFKEIMNSNLCSIFFKQLLIILMDKNLKYSYLKYRHHLIIKRYSNINENVFSGF